MKKTTSLVLATITAASVLGAGFISHTAFAASTTTGTSLASRIATKFGLKEAEVQTVITQNRTDHMAEMQVNEEARLTQAVTDGKITQAQKELIVAKQKELFAAHKADETTEQTLTPTERKAKFQKMRTDLETWATANKIDLKWLHGGFGGPRGGHGHHTIDKETADDTTPIATPAPTTN